MGSTLTSDSEKHQPDRARTTLRDIWQNSPNPDGYHRLMEALEDLNDEPSPEGEDPLDKPVDLESILTILGFSSAVWALRASQIPPKDLRTLAIRMAENVAPLYSQSFDGDQVIQRFLASAREDRDSSSSPKDSFHHIKEAERHAKDVMWNSGNHGIEYIPALFAATAAHYATQPVPLGKDKLPFYSDCIQNTARSARAARRAQHLIDLVLHKWSRVAQDFSPSENQETNSLEPEANAIILDAMNRLPLFSDDVFFTIWDFCHGPAKDKNETELQFQITLFLSLVRKEI